MAISNGTPTGVRIGRVRYKVVGFAVALAAVTYFDRVCISVLAPSIMSDLSLDKVQMGYVFSAFTLAYAIFEVPTAWWGEKIGTRKVLSRIVSWWSVFTLLTASAVSYHSLLVIRFLFGAGEAGAWPNAAKAFSYWIPASERGRVQGIFFMGAHLAGGITPTLVAFLLPLLGWRGVFVAFGSLGFIWTLAWYRWFCDDPAEHSQVSPEELEWITAGRRLEIGHGSTASRDRRSLFRNPSAWALCLSYFSNGYGFYFLITWLPTYLEEQRGFGTEALALFAGLPLLLSVLADGFGGLTTDYLSKRFGLRVGRCSVGFSAYIVAAIAMVLAPGTKNATSAALLIAVAAASSMFSLAASWATAIDLGGEHSGILSASMNSVGQVAGIASPIVLAYLVQNYSNWNMPLYLMAFFYLVSALCWLVLRPDSNPA